MPSGAGALRRSLLHFGEPHSPYDLALQQFCTLAAGNDLTVARAPATASESALLGEVAAGRLFGALVTTGAIAALIPQFYVADLPYLFDSPAHAWRFWKSQAGVELAGLAAGAGFVILAFYDAGTRHFFNSVRPAAVPADIANLRMRVLPNRYHALWITALGAQPVAMPTSSIRDAFVQKTIDGAERSYLNYRDLSLQDFAPYLTETAHFHLSACLVLSKPIWDEMTSTMHDRCIEAAQSSEDAERAAYRTSDDLARESLQQTRIQILMPDDAPWRVRAGSVHEAFAMEQSGPRFLHAAMDA